MRPEAWIVIRLLFVVVIYWFVWQAIRVSRRQMVGHTDNGDENDDLSALRRGDRPLGLLRVLDPADCAEVTKDQEIWFNGPLTLGRSEAADLRLPATTISQQHARITRDGGEWWITDLHSTNGTSVNGEAVVGRSRLQSGDQIRVGEVRFVFEG